MTLQPPREAAIFVRLIGANLTVRLMELHGGRTVYVPRKSGDGQKLAQALSPAAEAALIGEFGGMEIEVPICRTWRAQIYAGRGLGHREIATLLGCAQRSVRRYLAGGVDGGAEEQADTVQATFAF